MQLLLTELTRLPARLGGNKISHTLRCAFYAILFQRTKLERQCFVCARHKCGKVHNALWFAADLNARCLE
jgi:hypothetical protein